MPVETLGAESKRFVRCQPYVLDYVRLCGEKSLILYSRFGTGERRKNHG
jgi:hypothetical protein